MAITLEKKKPISISKRKTRIYKILLQGSDGMKQQLMVNLLTVMLVSFYLALMGN